MNIMHSRNARRAGKSAAGSARGCRTERGSALIVTLLACVVLAAIVAVSFRASSEAGKAAVVQDTVSESAAAAEYGVSRAIAEIAAWSRQEDNRGLDWVYGTDGERLYVTASSQQALDQRRFSGVFGDQDIRVLVRSAALAKEHGTMPDGWLWEPETGEQLYEIIATASDARGEKSALRSASSTMQTVLNINFQEGWSNGKDFGPYFSAQPSNFQVHLGENIVLSGEDHDINKYYVEKFETERIVTPLKLTTNTANFFGADGGYWRAGQLTLNYRIDPDSASANPYRPKTPNFGTSQDNRAMTVKDKSVPFEEYDTYLLGGKSSRTVTVDSKQTINGVVGYINETSSGQANEGGSFNIVLGAFEDLRNLYINMAGVTVSDFTDHRNWWQIYVGQYSHSPRLSKDANVTASLPNYGGTRIRAQTIHFMKNKDGHVLVRLYAVTSGGKTTYYKYPASGSKWTGYYCWADGTFSSGNGFRLNNNRTASGEVAGEAKNQRAVVRTFFWQELVGYQLVRRKEKNPSLSYPNEPAVIDQRDTPASGEEIDKRTIYRIGADGERLPAGFDEIYQAHKDNGIAGVSSDSRHPLYGDKYHDISPGYLDDRFDVIYVHHDDGTITSHPDMDSFLFEKDFGVDDDGNEIKRDALSLFIGYEDQRETTADYDYTDMMFTIYIAPAVEQKIIPYTMFTLLTDQWWEQNSDNGLTGGPSHPGLVTNSDPSAASAEDPYKVNYDALGYSPKADPSDPSLVTFEKQVYSMKTDGSREGHQFLRAMFETDSYGSLAFVPVYDEDTGLPITDRPYYYTEDDVNNYLIHEWNKGNKDIVTEEGREAARLLFPSIVPSQYTLKQMPARWDPSNVTQPILSETEADSAYAVMKTTESIRRIAGDIIGMGYQNVPVVKTYQYSAITDDYGLPVAAENEKLGYLAGEMVQDTYSSDLRAMPGESIPHRDRMVPQPDGTTTPVRIYTHEDPAEAVKMTFQDFYTFDTWTKEEMQGIYGIKDERYSIGFHRSGADDRFAERYSQDHYEVALLGQIGFNPFRETMNGKAIARNSEINPDGPDSPVYTLSYKYGQDNLVPDFVFDRQIDGAGILIVNGNLVVQDVFAYYGLLVVMGDVIIRPTYRADRFVYGADGNPTDSYGNSLYQSNGKWVYLWTNPENPENYRETSVVLNEEDGQPLLDASGQAIPVTPLYATGADAYRGRLVTQGNLLVNGRTITERVPNQFAPGEYITGELNCYANEAASQLSNKLSDISKDIVEVVSWTSVNSSTFTNTAQNLWTGELE